MEWVDLHSTYKGLWYGDLQHGLGLFTDEQGSYLGYFVKGVLGDTIETENAIDLIRKLDEYDEALTEHEQKFRGGILTNSKGKNILGASLNNMYLRKLAGGHGGRNSGIDGMDR